MLPVEKQGAVTVVRPQGPVTQATCANLVDDVIKSLGTGRPMLVVDLHAAPLIDSAGMEALLDLTDRIEARGGGVRLAAANPLCAEILRVTGVGHRFTQFQLVKAAVGSFAE